MNVTIKQKDDGKKGRFELYEEGQRIGELEYTWVGEDRFIIGHTEVDKNHGGKGHAKNLVLQAINFARKEKLTIIPLCPYAKSVFDKDESFADVLSQ